MTRITDGLGRGFEAGVDNTNHLLTEAVSKNIREDAMLKGELFEIGTSVTLTGTTETAVVFFQNDQDRTVVLDRFEFSASDSTGGTSDQMLLALYTNADGITNGTASQPINSNFGSGLKLVSTFEFGNGSTSAVTGGSQFGASYIKFAGQSIFEGPWGVPRGSNFVLAVTPPASNTSLPFTVRVLAHLERST